MFESRNCHANSGVIGDFKILIEGHVEINADKNATAGKIDVSNGSEH
jgi:hypothetical protein